MEKRSTPTIKTCIHKILLKGLYQHNYKFKSCSHLYENYNTMFSFRNGRELLYSHLEMQKNYYIILLYEKLKQLFKIFSVF